MTGCAAADNGSAAITVRPPSRTIHSARAELSHLQPRRYARWGSLGRMRLRSLVSVVAPPLCAGCGVSAGRVEPLCADCRRGLRAGGRVEEVLGVPTWAAFAYEGGARALVRALKFRGTAAVAATMAAQMAAGAPPDLLVGAALVPAPLHPA